MPDCLYLIPYETETVSPYLVIRRPFLQVLVSHSILASVRGAIIYLYAFVILSIVAMAV